MTKRVQAGKFLTYLCYNSCKFMTLAGKLGFGGLPCSDASILACRCLSADASMLCDGALMSAGQYAGICNIMHAWHVSMHGAALIRLYTYHSMECQQVEHMPVHTVRNNAMPAI